MTAISGETIRSRTNDNEDNHVEQSSTAITCIFSENAGHPGVLKRMKRSGTGNVVTPGNFVQSRILVYLSSLLLNTVNNTFTFSSLRSLP